MGRLTSEVRILNLAQSDSAHRLDTEVPVRSKKKKPKIVRTYAIILIKGT